MVKTSTGFGPQGATLKAVKIMKDSVGDKAGIKASGGIRDRETALEYIKAGATRIGTSSGVIMMKE
jgi:deoxyribose-phosphate aldolase